MREQMIVDGGAKEQDGAIFEQGQPAKGNWDKEVDVRKSRWRVVHNLWPEENRTSKTCIHRFSSTRSMEHSHRRVRAKRREGSQGQRDRGSKGGISRLFVIGGVLFLLFFHGPHD